MVVGTVEAGRAASPVLSLRAPATTSDRGGRLVSIDMLRGLIMVIMAIDHVSFFVARRHPVEYWGGAWTRYESGAWFLTRFVTHLCAPGFFFLMGAGMALLAAARRTAGWDDGRIRVFLVKRGVLLLLISQTVEVLAWGIGLLSSGVPDPASAQVPGAAVPARALLSVITGLGLSVIAGGLLLSLRNSVWWVAGVGALLASALATPAPEAAPSSYCAIQGAAGRLRGWLVVFGQAPLFYYIAHLYLYAIVGAVFVRQGTGVGPLYAIWATGLVPLYVLTRWYRDFKQSKPADSVWRFF